MAWAGGGGWQQQNAGWGGGNAGGGWGQQAPAQQGWGQQAGGQQAGVQQGWGQQSGGANGWGQPQQQQQHYQPQNAGGWQAQQPQQAAKPVAPPGQSQGGGGVTLVVTGCTHATVGGIVRGSFQLHAENHGKPTYKKDGQVNGLDVMMYYWDERDGPGFNGWWFGPVVGGDQVWAYHTDKSAMTPPASGWKVPYDGPVDPTFLITTKSAGAPAAQPQWGQQQQQQQPQQNSWQAQQQMQNQKMQDMRKQQEMQMQQQQQKLQEQKRQQEEMKKQQAMEQQQRLEDMRKKQQEEQQRRLEENRKKLEEANKKRMEDQKKKMDDMRQKQEEQKKKQEEEIKKKQEEMKKKAEEKTAVVKLQKAIQKFRTATPVNMNEFKQEFAAVVAEESPKLDGQKEAVTKQIEDAETFVRTKIENIEKKKKEEEEKKKAEEDRRRGLKTKAEELVKEFTQLVEAAESAAKGIAEEAEPFADEEREMKLAALKSAASAVESANEDFEEKFKACKEFADKNGPGMKNVPPIAGEEASTAPKDAQSLLQRMNASRVSAVQTVKKAMDTKAQKSKKLEAIDEFEKQQSAFTKYDGDKDGLLSKVEVKKMAKALYKFDCPAECLTMIFEVLAPDGGKGVKKTDFQRLKVLIGIAREKDIDSKRKTDRVAKDKHIADVKEQLSEKVAELTKEVNGTQEEIQKLEQKVNSLPGQTKGSVGAAVAKAVKSTEMHAAVDETEEMITSARSTVASAKENVTALEAPEDELNNFVQSSVKRLSNQLTAYEGRINKVASMLAKFKIDADKKNEAELEQLRIDVLAMLRYHQGAKKLSNLELFTEIDSGKAGKIDESDFVSFIGKCVKDPTKRKDGEESADSEIEENDLSRLFKHLDSDKTGAITKDTFVSMIRQFMKVVKAAIISDGLSVKDSKTIRRMEPDEVVEVLKGPIIDEKVGLARVQVKCLEDGKTGWLTPVGNHGSVFLKEGGGTMKVVKETILTGSFKIGDKDDKKTKKLKEGEIVEIREWGKKDATGLTRMQVKVKSDGTVGWVTSLGNTGIVFLELV